MSTSNYKYEYYPDLHKKYKQFANKNGHDLLNKLSKKVDTILVALKNEMIARHLDPEQQLKEGFRIYDQKPSQHKGVTWSDDEYKHLGFQSVYIKTKSIQRFTEVYNLLVRAHNNGYFDNLMKKHKKRLNIISIGGGPGFELYSMQLFFKKFYKDLKLTLTTVDLNDLWKYPNQIFGIKFIPGSFYDPKIIKEIQTYDLSIMSYVLYNYFNNKQSAASAKSAKSAKSVESAKITDYWSLVKDMFAGKMGMMLINSREKKRIEILDYLQKNQLNVYELINPKDNRQVLISKDKLAPNKLASNKSPSNNSTKKYQLPFLDVPY